MPKERIHSFIEIDRIAECVYLVSGNERRLVKGFRRQAFRLVQHMFSESVTKGGVPRVCAHDELQKAVWGHRQISNGPAQIARLVFEIRKSLFELDERADLIQSVPGLGYILRDGGLYEQREGEYPYVCGPPIMYPQKFYGRTLELRRIFAVWDRFPLQHIALIGQKRSGKTSLLRFLDNIHKTPKYELRPGQASSIQLRADAPRTVFIDCQDPRLQTPGAMMSYILELLELSTPRPCSPSSFAECLSELSCPTVFLFDELEAALFSPEFSESFWMGLRSLANHASAGQLGFVIALHSELSGLVSTKASPSPFLNIFGHLLYLGPLTESEGRELIGSSPEPFSEDDVQWILSKSGCHPCLLQLLCDSRLTAIHESQTEEQWKKEGLARISHFQHLLGTHKEYG